jgi:hypothetical protein
MGDKDRAILNLRAVAAMAAKLADDLQANRLWEGECSTAMAEIQRAIRDVPSIR